MNKILKFPEINGPASKKEFEILAKLMNEVNEREEESYNATMLSGNHPSDANATFINV